MSGESAKKKRLAENENDLGMTSSLQCKNFVIFVRHHDFLL